MLRSKSNRPKGLTRPFRSRRATSQSTWSVSEYQVKPRTGTPSWCSRMTPDHFFHSQCSASSPRGVLLQSLAMATSRLRDGSGQVTSRRNLKQLGDEGSLSPDVASTKISNLPLPDH